MPTTDPHPADPPAPATAPALHVELWLHRPPGAQWQVEARVDGQALKFPSLLSLIGWLARLGSGDGGIR